MKCSFCNSVDTEVKMHHQVFEIKNQEILVDSSRRFCKNCHQLVYDEILDQEASLKAIEEYNKKFGIMGEQIVSLRHNLGLSQELFAKVIGCAKKTLISYEKNQSVPNDIYLILIKTILQDPNSIQTIISANQERFTTSELEKLKRSAPNIESMIDKKVSIFNGYLSFQFEKFKNLILILCKEKINKTKLLKECFYIDFLSYKYTGQSLTGTVYAKLPYGPVPEKFAMLLDCLYSQKVLTHDLTFKGDYEADVYCSIRSADTTIFTKEELDLIDKVKSYFKEFTSSEIVNYVHQEKAFLDSEFCKAIRYDYAFDISDFLELETKN